MLKIINFNFFDNFKIIPSVNNKKKPKNDNLVILHDKTEKSPFLLQNSYHLPALSLFIPLDGVQKIISIETSKNINRVPKDDALIGGPW